MSHSSPIANSDDLGKPADAPLSENSTLSVATQRPRRTSAKRSCFNCREKKTRCELPDLYVPSSKQPVIESKRCHRCKVLRIDCIVWDGDRKRKVRLPAQEDAAQQDKSHSKRARPTMDPQSHSPDSPEVMQTSDQGSPHPLSYSLFQQYRTVESHSPAASTISERTLEGIHDNDEMTRSRHSPQPIESSTIQPAECLHLDDGKEKMVAVMAHHKTNKSAWRILTILVDYSAQHPQFRRYLLHRISSPQPPIRPIDIMDMIDRNECLELSSCMMPYLVWHPHLPPLESLYDLNNHHISRPTSFLLATMYLIASRHRHSLSSTIMKGLSATVDRLGTQLILSSTRHIRIVQALDLLIAHEPSLVGTSATGDEDEQAYRGSGLAGEKLLSSAVGIARDLGLDRSVHAIQNHLQNQRHELQGTQNKMQDLLNVSSLWISLRIWEGHYVFFKPMNRVIRDLGELADASTCLIAIDGSGNKIENTISDPYGTNTEPKQSDKIKEAAYLRSAGRTILAYRIKTMAVIHRCLYEITDILSSPKDINRFVQSSAFNIQSQQTLTTPEVKDKIVNVILKAFDERPKISQMLHMDMIPFTALSTVYVAEEWTDLEWNALLASLSTFGICCLHAGEPDAGFTIRSFLEAMPIDSKFRECVSILGENRLELSERLVSSFAFFNRRLTPAMDNTGRSRRGDLIELTGAPIFLTCGFVLDSCRLFLEGTAFVLVTYQSIQNNFDSRLLSMIQAAQRLDELDRNNYSQEDYHQTTPTDKPPLSITQISANFIREIIETLQRWKLGSSMYRKPALSRPIYQIDTTPANEVQDGSVHDSGTPKSINNSTSSEADYDPNLTPLQRESATPFPSTPNSVAASEPVGTSDSLASGLNMHPFIANSQYGAQPQTGFAYSNDYWEADTNFRALGSLDQLLSSPFPEPQNAGDMNVFHDVTFLGNYLDSMF
ncbi:hypothetical protein BGZ76_010167 [Entomortierella beljakovae]|nr:hypothetical protein BGZ76_010167 [Entomortierella beljakovae]